MNSRQDEQAANILMSIVTLGAVFGIWYAGAEDKSIYENLSTWEQVGQAIGDFFRGFGIIWNGARDSVLDWLGFS